jgi:hypothetical protein
MGDLGRRASGSQRPGLDSRACHPCLVWTGLPAASSVPPPRVAGPRASAMPDRSRRCLVATLRYSVSCSVLSLSAAFLLAAGPRGASADEAAAPAADT